MLDVQSLRPAEFELVRAARAAAVQARPAGRAAELGRRTSAKRQVLVSRRKSQWFSRRAGGHDCKTLSQASAGRRGTVGGWDMFSSC